MAREETASTRTRRARKNLAHRQNGFRRRGMGSRVARLGATARQPSEESRNFDRSVFLAAHVGLAVFQWLTISLAPNWFWSSMARIACQVLSPMTTISATLAAVAA